MQHALYSADWIFTGRDWKQGGFLLFVDGVFVCSYENQSELPSGLNPTHISGILCPGLVNAHCHLELSHMLGRVRKGTGLTGFIRDLQAVRSLETNAASRVEAMYLADQAMFASGIQAVGDISNGPESIEVKEASQIVYHTFVESFGIQNGEEEKILNRSFDLACEFKRRLHTGRVSMVPHALYSTSQVLVSQILHHPSNLGAPVSIHFMEDASEEAFLQNGTGPFREMLQSFGITRDRYFIPGFGSPGLIGKLAPAGSKLLLVHGLHMSQQDWDYLYSLNTNLHLALCASANRYISGRLPDPGRFPAQHLCLGTDSLASNESLNLLDEMKCFGELGYRMRDLLPWVTVQGAKALNLEDSCGSFIAGKNTGLLQFKNVAPDDLPHAAEVVRIY